MTPQPRRHFETIQSAAERTGLSVRTIYRRIQTGQLRVYRSGRTVRLDPADVDAMFTCSDAWTAA